MVPDEHVHIQQINKSVQKQSEEDLVLFFASPERKKQIRGKLKSQNASYFRFNGYSKISQYKAIYERKAKEEYFFKNY